jgi:hypothetical protein
MDSMKRVKDESGRVGQSSWTLRACGILLAMELHSRPGPFLLEHERLLRYSKGMRYT